MTGSVDPELIALQGEQLQDLNLTSERCAELAAEVGRYNQTVRAAAGELTFDDEPADFARSLLALRADQAGGAGDE